MEQPNEKACRHSAGGHFAIADVGMPHYADEEEEEEEYDTHYANSKRSSAYFGPDVKLPGGRG